MALRPPNLSVKSDAAQLVSQLRSAKLSSAQLATLWKVHRGELPGKLVRGPIVIGIPVPDLLRGQVSVKPGDLGKFTEKLGANPAVRSWRVFPVGIINPERYVVEVDLGARP